MEFTTTPTYKLEDYLKGKCTLSQYYRQFICQNILFDVSTFIGKNRIVLSETKYFTDIADCEWINSIRSKETILKERIKAAEHYHLNLSDLICIAKEAGEIIRTKELVA